MSVSWGDRPEVSGVEPFSLRKGGYGRLLHDASASDRGVLLSPDQHAFLKIENRVLRNEM